MPARRVELTVAQVATITGASASTIRWWIKRRHLTRTRRGLIDAADLLAYLERRGDRGQHARSRLSRQYLLATGTEREEAS